MAYEQCIFSANSFPSTWLSKHLTLQPRPTYNLPQVLHCLTFWWKPRLCRTFQIFSSFPGFTLSPKPRRRLGACRSRKQSFQCLSAFFTAGKHAANRATGLWRRQLRVSLSLNKYSSSFVWQFVRQRKEKNKIDKKDEFCYWFVNYLLQLSAKGAELGIG